MAGSNRENLKEWKYFIKNAYGKCFQFIFAPLLIHSHVPASTPSARHICMNILIKMCFRITNYWNMFHLMLQYMHRVSEPHSWVGSRFASVGWIHNGNFSPSRVDNWMKLNASCEFRNKKKLFRSLFHWSAFSLWLWRSLFFKGFILRAGKRGGRGWGREQCVVAQIFIAFRSCFIFAQMLKWNWFG